MHKTLFETQSNNQRIKLLQDDGGYWLILNDKIQFHQNEHITSHYLQCDIPVRKFRPKRVLILGGGDCLAASHVLKYDFVEEVEMVEIDSEMRRMVRETPLMKKITNNVIENPKLKVNIDDAEQFLIKNDNQYDLIIEDVEPISERSNYEYFKKMFAKRSVISLSIGGKQKFINTKVFERQYLKNQIYGLENAFWEFKNFKKCFPKGVIFEELEERRVYACANNYGNSFGFESYIIID